MEINDLKKPFARELISWRVGAVNKEKTKAIALAYIDARDVMQRLDDVCGVNGWQCLHPHAEGKTSCKIGIFCPPKKELGGSWEWIWKENGCGDSQVEAEKGAFSDALKRAAVLWGIGRYLYDVPNIWVDIIPYGKSYKIKDTADHKLSKALEAAEKGIRLPSEPEPEEPKITQLLGEEFLLLQTEIRESKDIDELKNTMEKVNAAVKRMTPQQKDTLIKDKDKRKQQLSTTENPIG